MTPLDTYRAQALRELQRRGFGGRREATYQSHAIEDREQRLQAWYAESLAMALESIAQCDDVMALRTYAQVCAYRGELRGLGAFDAHYLGDAAAYIRNYLEDRLQRSPHAPCPADATRCGK